jgi:hypothetical protein
MMAFIRDRRCCSPRTKSGLGKKGKKGNFRFVQRKTWLGLPKCARVEWFRYFIIIFTALSFFFFFLGIFFQSSIFRATSWFFCCVFFFFFKTFDKPILFNYRMAAHQVLDKFSLETPFGVALYPYFDKVYTAVTGKSANSFAFVEGVTPLSTQREGIHLNFCHGVG